MPKKNPQKRKEAWKGIPSQERKGWQYLFLVNEVDQQGVVIHIPRRYGIDKRGYEPPDNRKYVKIKGVRYGTHLKEHSWDSLLAKRNLDRLFSAGFKIVPPEQLGINSLDDLKQMMPNLNQANQNQRNQHNKQQKGDGQQGQNGQPQPGQQGQQGQSGQNGQQGQGQGQQGGQGKSRSSQDRRGNNGGQQNSYGPRGERRTIDPSASTSKYDPGQRGQNNQSSKSQDQNNQSGMSPEQQRQQQQAEAQSRLEASRNSVGLRKDQGNDDGYLGNDNQESSSNSGSRNNQTPKPKNQDQQGNQKSQGQGQQGNQSQANKPGQNEQQGQGSQQDKNSQSSKSGQNQQGSGDQTQNSEKGSQQNQGQGKSGNQDKNQSQQSPTAQQQSFGQQGQSSQQDQNKSSQSGQQGQAKNGQSQDKQGQGHGQKEGGDKQGQQTEQGQQQAQGSKGEQGKSDSFRDPNQESAVNTANNTSYDQHAKNSEKSNTENKGSVNTQGKDADNGNPDTKKQEKDAGKVVAKEAEKNESHIKKTATGQDTGKHNLTEGEKKYVFAKKRNERKRRGGRQRLGHRVVEVDRFARGEAGDGSRVRGIYAYGDIVHNQKIARAAAESVDILSMFIGKSQSMTEYGVRADIPDLIVRLESGDNPLPSLERPNERPKMRIMISPDCSPSTQEWNGLACAWAIALAKNPELDVLFVPNSNGEPVKVSQEKYLTIMNTCDIIVYLGDSDGMQHNIDWAKTHHQHVIALSSVQRSIGNIPPWKASQNKVHLIVQKYGNKGVLRYATGVQSKTPRTWVKALQLCLESLNDNK